MTAQDHGTTGSTGAGAAVARSGAATAATSSTPVEVVRRYLDEIYHAGEVEVVREITADGVVRHDPGGTRTLDHEQQIARIRADLPTWEPWFTAEVLAGDADYAVLVWTARGRTADRLLTGIEVFRVREGRITDVWNTPYSTSAWG